MSDQDDAVRHAGGPASEDQEVRRGGRVVGHVRPFTMGAGQFGTTWAAISDGGAKRTGFQTRDAAVDWLLALVGD